MIRIVSKLKRRYWFWVLTAALIVVTSFPRLLTPVRAQDNATTLTPPILTAPPITAIFTIGNTISLQWQATAGATEYFVEVTPTDGSPSKSSGWITATSWSITAEKGGVVTWRVKARNAGEESAWTNIRGLATRPVAPVNISAAAPSPQTIQVSWLPSPNNLTNMRGYFVLRNGQSIADVPGTTTSYLDEGLNCGTIYSYAMRTYILGPGGLIVSEESTPINAPSLACITPTATATSTPTATATATNTPDAPDTIGIYRPSTNNSYLRYSNSTGVADLVVTLSSLGMNPNAPYLDKPVVGDWNGDGIDTAGFYRSSTGEFVLSNSNSTPNADYYFVLGSPGDQPLVGDWNGDGVDGVAIFRPSNGLFYLRNQLTTGFADFSMILGLPGDIGIAGDWDNDGVDSPGVFRSSSTQAVFYLSNQVCDCAVMADYTVALGMPNDVPFAGDWDGDGRTGLGVFRSLTGLVYLKNDPTNSGFGDVEFTYGVASDIAFAGVWSTATAQPTATATATPTATAPEIAPTFEP